MRVGQRWIVFFLIGQSSLLAQELKTKNVIVVTLDGFRWQELFKGPDSVLSFNGDIRDKSVINKFWGADSKQRRKKLLPFFWNVIARQGQLYGNRTFRNFFNCKNRYLFSYPGYSEMLVGFVEETIASNGKIENPNSTVLEFIHHQKDFAEKVAAFATWEVFRYILRHKKSDIHISVHNTIMPDSCCLGYKNDNNLPAVIQQFSAADDLTFHYAFKYLQEKRPRVLFIGFDRTDIHAHRGRYDDYLNAAHRYDDMIHQLWDWVQSQDDYREQTTLIITTDHGRGANRTTWRFHGSLIFNSAQTWLAVLGPDTPPLGEIKTPQQHFQHQIAATIAAFLGFEYVNRKQVGALIRSAFHDKALLSSKLIHTDGKSD